MVVNQEKQRFYFSQTQRLLKPDDFKYVFDKPNFKVHQPNILFFIKMREPIHNLTSDFQLTCRLGLAITKKKIKRANQRNRLKRLIREQFRLCQYDFDYVCDVVVIVKVGTQSLSNEALLSQIHTGFKQVIYKVNQFSQA